MCGGAIDGFLVEDFVSILSDSRSGNIAGSGLVAPTTPAKPPTATCQGSQLSTEWLNVFESLESLRKTLEAYNLLVNHPEVKHDLVVLLSRLEAVRGDTLFADFWRAQHARLQQQQTRVTIATADS